MTSIGVVTQARMGSTRLPGKVMLEAGGRTMLSHHVGRLQDAGLIVVVATTTSASDEPIVEAAHLLGAAVHRGDEHDVLGRFDGAAGEFGLDIVVRVTSDCPLIDGSVVWRGIEMFRDQDDPDLYLSNTVERSWPRGFDFEVFSSQALSHAHRHATLPGDREHVTPYLYSGRSTRTRVQQLRRASDASDLRVTLDTPEDFELIRRLIDEHDAAALDAEQIIEVLDQSPDLSMLNSTVVQKGPKDR